MSTSPTITPANLDLGPCTVTFNSVDLGATLGNVTVKWKYFKSPFKADQYGQTLLDHAISGIDITITTDLAEIKNKDNWSVVFPNATVHTHLSNKAIHWDDKMTIRDASQAQKLVLHPLANDSGDASQDWTFFKAVSTEESQFVLSPTEQQKLHIVWRVYPDYTTTPAQFFVFGDTTIS